MQVGVPRVPCPPPDPFEVLDKSQVMPVDPPASAMYPDKVSVPFAPSAAFSGVKGCRNPGVMVTTADAVMLGFEVSAAVTVTCTLFAVR